MVRNEGLSPVFLLHFYFDQEITRVIVELIVIHHKLDKALVFGFDDTTRARRVDALSDTHDERTDAGFRIRKVEVIPTVAIGRTRSVRRHVDLFDSVRGPTDNTVCRDLYLLPALHP